MERLTTDDTAARKRLFLGLITASSILLLASLALLWIVPAIGLASIHWSLPAVAGGFTAVVMLLVIWAWLSLVLRIVLKRPVLWARSFQGLTITCMLPLMSAVGMLLGISKEKVRNSFIKVNNELVLQELSPLPPQKILILLPHCLQSSHCVNRLTYHLDHCTRCGACPISGLLVLAETFGVQLAIATGGTIARRIVVQSKPAMIIAVACERDLTSGIQDATPIPVYGVLNERPCGPCLDTRVNFDVMQRLLETAVQSAFPEAAVPQPRLAPEHT